MIFYRYVEQMTSCICHYLPQFPTGRGAITANQISLTSFLSDSQTFTLLGDTSGGPPTTYTWRRDGQVITNSSSYSISIQTRERTNAGFQNSRYRSTLTVTGRLPGVYQYSVTNRVTSGMVTDSFTIDGKNQGRIQGGGGYGGCNPPK